MWEDFVDAELYNYITTIIFEKYKLNGKSHNQEHIKEVLNRALEISKNYTGINKNILFTAIAYHDIGDHIDRKNHEIVSANMMMEDDKLNKFFNDEEKILIKDAIEDHRSSKGKTPRNIYGKILASADKNTDVNLYFYRACEFSIEHYKDATEQQQLDTVYSHAIEKFGKNGYAIDKYYVQDDKYEKYLNNLQELIENMNLRIQEYISKGFKSIAIIGKDMSECIQIEKSLSQRISSIKLIKSKDSEYNSGISIVPSYLAKGLEFDCVIIADASDKKYAQSSLDIKLLYVAITRAMSKLDIFYIGNISKLCLVRTAINGQENKEEK